MQSRVRGEYLGHESELETDFTRQDSIILNLQGACEASIDIAMHMTRKQRLGLPQDARDALKLLETDGIISPGIGRHTRAMVGFRNVAGHQCQALSIPVLRSILEDPFEDFSAFTRTLIQST